MDHWKALLYWPEVVRETKRLSPIRSDVRILERRLLEVRWQFTVAQIVISFDLIKSYMVLSHSNSSDRHWRFSSRPPLKQWAVVVFRTSPSRETNTCSWFFDLLYIYIYAYLWHEFVYGLRAIGIKLTDEGDGREREEEKENVEFATHAIPYLHVID